MIVLYILLGIIATLLIASALMPKVYNVEKSTIIRKPVSTVKEHVSNFNHYAGWNPWQKMEPAATKSITGTPGTSGHKYSWQGKKIGIGNLTVNHLDDKHVHLDLEFIKPWKGTARDNWLFEEWGNGETKVTWQDFGMLPYPIGRLLGYMIHKNLNRQFTEGLNNLKKFREK